MKARENLGHLHAKWPAQMNAGAKFAVVVVQEHAICATEDLRNRCPRINMGTSSEAEIGDQKYSRSSGSRSGQPGNIENAINAR